MGAYHYTRSSVSLPLSNHRHNNTYNGVRGLPQHHKVSAKPDATHDRKGPQHLAQRKVSWVPDAEHEAPPGQGAEHDREGQADEVELDDEGDGAGVAGCHGDF